MVACATVALSLAGPNAGTVTWPWLPALWKLWGSPAQALGSVGPFLRLSCHCQGPATRALEGWGAAIRVLLVYFAGDDDNFLPAAHSLINSSEDVG